MLFHVFNSQEERTEYGINYYAPFFTDSIIARLHEKKPADYGILAEWLDKAKIYNGFYILGI